MHCDVDFAFARFSSLSRSVVSKRVLLNFSPDV